MNQPSWPTTWASVPEIQVGDDAYYTTRTDDHSGDHPAAITMTTRDRDGKPVVATVYTQRAAFVLVRDLSLALGGLEEAEAARIIAAAEALETAALTYTRAPTARSFGEALVVHRSGHPRNPNPFRFSQAESAAYLMDGLQS